MFTLLVWIEAGGGIGIDLRGHDQLQGIRQFMLHLAPYVTVPPEVADEVFHNGVSFLAEVSTLEQLQHQVLEAMLVSKRFHPAIHTTRLLLAFQSRRELRQQSDKTTKQETQVVPRRTLVTLTQVMNHKAR